MRMRKGRVVTSQQPDNLIIEKEEGCVCLYIYTQDGLAGLYSI